MPKVRARRIAAKGAVPRKCSSGIESSYGRREGGNVLRQPCEFFVQNSHLILLSLFKAGKPGYEFVESVQDRIGLISVVAVHIYVELEFNGHFL